jgi:hypothetical protein
VAAVAVAGTGASRKQATQVAPRKRFIAPLNTNGARQLRAALQRSRRSAGDLPAGPAARGAGGK